MTDEYRGETRFWLKFVGSFCIGSLCLGLLIRECNLRGAKFDGQIYNPRLGIYEHVKLIDTHGDAGGIVGSEAWEIKVKNDLGKNVIYHDNYKDGSLDYVVIQGGKTFYRSEYADLPVIREAENQYRVYLDSCKARIKQENRDRTKSAISKLNK